MDLWHEIRDNSCNISETGFPICISILFYKIGSSVYEPNAIAAHTLG